MVMDSTRTSPEGAAETVIWQTYHEYANGAHGRSVVGDLRVAPQLYSAELHNRRDLLVYLPPSYRLSSRRYPVIYMHDGQNLFDNATSFAGEWGVDETMEQLAYTEGLEAIIVGIPNAGVARLGEYSPFVDSRLGGGRGDKYLSFLVDTVKPLVDRDFRTLPDRRHTGIMGSSMGGLISLYGFFRRADTFGYVGAMSPSLWYAGDAIFDYVQHAPYRPGKIYLDVGTRELGEQSGGRLHRATASRRYYASVRRLKSLLIRKGYRPLRDLMHVEEKWAGHGESSWARRLAPALRFLLSEALRQTSG